MNISEFKKGDIVVRTETSDPIGGERRCLITGQVIQPIRDRSYMGEAMTLVSVANGMCYLDRVKEDILGQRVELSLYFFSNGWEYFQDPDSAGVNRVSVSDGNSVVDVIFFIKNAMQSEDYETLAKIKEALK